MLDPNWENTSSQANLKPNARNHQHLLYDIWNGLQLVANQTHVVAMQQRDGKQLQDSECSYRTWTSELGRQFLWRWRAPLRIDKKLAISNETLHTTFK